MSLGTSPFRSWLCRHCSAIYATPWPGGTGPVSHNIDVHIMDCGPNVNYYQDERGYVSRVIHEMGQ